MSLRINPQDTIAAIATPSGNGGVGIIRISGLHASHIAQELAGKLPLPRQACFTPFRDADASILDSGLLLYFPAPHSYTGEDVVELQAHGGAVLMDMLLQRVLALGARLANPGEFTERAFLNNKLDLAQAEAVADLITSSTRQAVRSAQQSLQGVFSAKITQLVEELTELRIYVEAAIDFVDEEIDFLSDGVVARRLQRALTSLAQIQATAQQGRLLRDGMTIVLTGKPNAGKSSLLNALAGHDAAIVTDIPGTTRDVLKERIQLDGMPLNIIDTAGLRDNGHAGDIDPIEQEGIRRARLELAKADLILWLADVQDRQTDEWLANLPQDIPITRVYNKIDLPGLAPACQQTPEGTTLYLSVKTGAGLDLLTAHLKQAVGYKDQAEPVFIARRRHLQALADAQIHMQAALQQLENQPAGELLAEELRLAQNYLGEITGAISADDLLGKIFASFCIGK